MIAMPSTRVLSRGFTLIELLTVTSLVAILLAIGIPSFQFVTSSNRASSEINGLLGDMQFARAEAIKQGQTVTICASASPYNACSGDPLAWKSGWIVFADTGVVGTVDGSEALSILKMQKTFSGNDTLAADQATSVVSFNRDGFAMGVANPVKFKLTTSPLNNQYTRCLSLTIVGAISTQISGATTAQGTAC